MGGAGHAADEVHHLLPRGGRVAARIRVKERDAFPLIAHDVHADSFMKARQAQFENTHQGCRMRSFRRPTAMANRCTGLPFPPGRHVVTTLFR